MQNKIFRMSMFFLFCFFCAITIQAQETYEVKLDGQPFATYVTDYHGSPIIYPIIGPTGKKMTRDYPMSEHSDKSENKDHPHHRSMWFTHGNVNGLDFWSAEKTTQETKYRIVHRRFIKKESDGKTAVIVTENNWLGKDNQPVCSDVRSLRFGTIKDMRFIDFDITVTAVQETVVFGDTKEGTFGIRVPGTMDVTAKKRDPNSDWGGHIVNAEGIKDGAAWAKRSDWVDYYGTVEGEILGIAILNHPSSFRYPTYWHVRDYGLFAANPFGVHDFENKTELVGEHRMNKDDSFTLRYRVLFHKGDAESAGIAEAFKQYAAEQK